MARSVAERSAADVRSAELEIAAYKEGTFQANLRDTAQGRVILFTNAEVGQLGCY